MHGIFFTQIIIIIRDPDEVFVSRRLFWPSRRRRLWLPLFTNTCCFGFESCYSRTCGISSTAISTCIASVYLVEWVIRIESQTLLLIIQHLTMLNGPCIWWLSHKLGAFFISVISVISLHRKSTNGQRTIVHRLLNRWDWVTCLFLSQVNSEIRTSKKVCWVAPRSIILLLCFLWLEIGLIGGWRDWLTAKLPLIFQMWHSLWRSNRLSIMIESRRRITIKNEKSIYSWVKRINEETYKSDWCPPLLATESWFN